MNKIRQIGLGLLVLGIILHFSLAQYVSYFIIGIIIGLGIGLLITGKVKKTSN